MPYLVKGINTQEQNIQTIHMFALCRNSLTSKERLPHSMSYKNLSKVFRISQKEILK